VVKLSAVASIAALLAAACDLPSDEGDGFFVVLDAPTQVIEPGQLLPLTGRVYHRIGADSAELQAVSLRWSSSLISVATVRSTSPTSAVVTGISRGATIISTTVLDYDRVVAPKLRVRVSPPIAIDSVGPTTVPYGAQITLHGHGLEAVEQAVLGGGALVPDTATFIEEPDGLGTLRLWVPFPASNGRVVLLSTTGSGAASRRVVTVLPFDLYDTLAAPVTSFVLDGPPLRGEDTLVFNPALALVSGELRDDYRLVRSDTSRPITIVASTLGRTVEQFDPVLASVRLPQDEPFGSSPVGDEQWAVGLGGQYCFGTFVPLPRPVGRTAAIEVVRAYKHFPARELHLSVFGEGAGRYALTVRDAYVLRDSRIEADRFEDNEDCVAADRMASDSARSIDLSTPFADTLTIDNPFDPDWFRFEVPAGAAPSEPSLVNIKVAPRPFADVDSSDIGVLVIDRPFSRIVAESHLSGSYEDLTAELRSGQYFLLVVDEGGAATRYSLCLALGAACTLPPN
jgi:hypothetical protein